MALRIPRRVNTSDLGLILFYFLFRAARIREVCLWLNRTANKLFVLFAKGGLIYLLKCIERQTNIFKFI